MIFATRLLFWTDAFTVNQDLILIHPRSKGDTPLIAHEQVHQRQMSKVGTATFWWRYLFSRAFRQAREIEAYKVQIARGASAITCARHLATNYRLGITQAQALELLSGN